MGTEFKSESDCVNRLQVRRLRPRNIFIIHFERAGK